MSSIRPVASSAGDALPSHVVAYDIETVPDPGMPAPADEAFPKPIRHRVVCISVAVARIDREPVAGGTRYEVEEIRSGGNADWDEARLLRGFWRMLAGRPCKLVGWNSRRFDWPVLRLRSLLHGLDAGIGWRRGDRWSGYDARYSETWAVDLMDALSAYGATTPHGLDEVAVGIGLPGKAGEDGGKVADMVAAGDIPRVRRYCETDVANTLGIWFRYERLRGQLDADGHAAAAASLRRCLERDPEGAPHLADFARRWVGDGGCPAGDRIAASGRREPFVADPGPRSDGMHAVVVRHPCHG